MFKRITAIAILSLLIGVGVGSSITQLSRQFNDVSSTTISLVQKDDIKRAVNEYRSQNGRDALATSGSLDGSSQQRAEFLCDNNVWSHDGWTVSLTDYKATAVKVGENLQYGDLTQTARTIVDGWANSPAHNANMLDEVYTQQGMGVRICDEFQGEKEVVIIVNHFGKP